MNFKKYNSIENSYRQKYLNYITMAGYSQSKVLWQVEEKIHGANFSFWTDGKTVRCAKRSGFIREDENFFNYKDILEKYQQNVLDMFNGVNAAQGERYSTLTIYGELFGGGYNHPDVPKTNHSRVQRGVEYAPQQDFLAYDIAWDGNISPPGTIRGVFNAYGIPYVPILKVGTLEECLAYSNEFQTGIPALYGLPEIENNICEGVVIKPYEVLYFGSGNRVILKNKNPKWSEKSNKKVKVEVVATPEVQKQMDHIGEFITENRLKNVISKIGEVGNKDFGKLLSSFSSDFIEDFMKEQEGFMELGKKDQKRVTKWANTQAANVIRSNFVNILDGNF